MVALARGQYDEKELVRLASNPLSYRIPVLWGCIAHHENPAWLGNGLSPFPLVLNELRWDVDLADNALGVHCGSCVCRPAWLGTELHFFWVHCTRHDVRFAQLQIQLCFCWMLQWAFKLHNGRHIIKDTDKTTLAFNSADEAREWHQAFQSIIADLAAKQGVEVSRSPARVLSLVCTSGAVGCMALQENMEEASLFQCASCMRDLSGNERGVVSVQRRGHSRSNNETPSSQRPRRPRIQARLPTAEHSCIIVS